MPLLDNDSYNTIFDLLDPFTKTEEQRRQLVESLFRGKKSKKPALDYSGESEAFRHRLIQRLVEYGDIDGIPSLWALLQYLLTQPIGTDKEEKNRDLESHVNVPELRLMGDDDDKYNDSSSPPPSPVKPMPPDSMGRIRLLVEMDLKDFSAAAFQDALAKLLQQSHTNISIVSMIDQSTARNDLLVTVELSEQAAKTLAQQGDSFNLEDFGQVQIVDSIPIATAITSATSPAKIKGDSSPTQPEPQKNVASSTIRLNSHLANGRYRIDAKLGEGGMGVVYKGFDTQSNQPVAIKQLRDTIDPDLVERFQREGEVLRDLNHPNIVKLLDIVQDVGHQYLVLEFVSGGDLSQLLAQQKTLSMHRILNLALKVTDALTLAHREGVIHRDIKPANILLTDNNTVRLTDFGIAFVKGQPSSTEPGLIIGSPQYMSPEQIQGEPIDVTADIWSFGVILYEMLTGSRPFKGRRITELIVAIVSPDPPDYSGIRQDTPATITELVKDMLEKDKLNRTQSMRYVGLTIEEAIQALGTPPPVISPVDAILNARSVQPASSLPKSVTPVYRVMISCTSVDLSVHRQAAAKATIERRMLPMTMDEMFASPYGAIDASLEFVDEADIYIGIFANRYGHIPIDPRNPNEISITEMEYHRALEHNIPILIFIQDESLPVGVSFESPQHQKKLHNLKEQLKKDYSVNFFKSPVELGGQVFKALTKLLEDFQNKGIVPQPLPSSDKFGYGEHPIIVVPNPLDFDVAGRDRIISRVKSDVMADKSIALQGIPGIGKSVIANVVMHDEAIQQHFDGILWIDLGSNLDVFEKLETVCINVRILPERIKELKTISARQAAIREQIADKHLLIVIDNVWPTESEENELRKYDTAIPFRLGGKHAVYAITTRSPAVANDFVGFQNVLHIPSLTIDEGVQVLRSLAPEFVQALPDEARQLVDDVYGSPMALNLISKRLRQGGNFEPMMRQHLTEVKQGGGDHLDLQNATLEESINAISDTGQQALAVFALFPAKPNTFAEAAIEAVTGDNDAAIDLWQAGLISPEPNNRYSLHPIIADYARNKLSAGNSVARLIAFYRDYVKQHNHQFGILRVEMENVERSLKLAQESADKDNMSVLFAEIVNHLNYYWEDNGLRTQMYDKLTTAHTLLSQDKHPEQYAFTLVNMSRYYDFVGDSDKAMEHLVQAQILLDNLNTPEATEVKLHYDYTRGRTEAINGNLTLGMSIWLDTLKMAQSIKHTDYIITLYSGLGLANKLLGKFPAARRYFEDGWKVAETNITDNLVDATAYLLMNYGSFEAEQDNDAMAEKYFHQGLEMTSKVDNPKLRAFFLNNIAEMLSRQEVYEEAELYFKDSLTIAEELKSPENIRYARYGLGDLKLKQKLYDEATTHLNVALDIGRDILKDEFAISGALNLLARTYCEKGEKDRGRSLLDEAKQSAEQLIGQQKEQRNSEIEKTQKSCNTTTS